MKANHNRIKSLSSKGTAVSNGSKILKWKQITTKAAYWICYNSCFQWFKDTKMKANHNNIKIYNWTEIAVSNGSKILKWKQITTCGSYYLQVRGCFQWFKDTKMKANHNMFDGEYRIIDAVSNGSKILKWKQITTGYWIGSRPAWLFPMVQRY